MQSDRRVLENKPRLCGLAALLVSAVCVMTAEPAAQVRVEALLAEIGRALEAGDRAHVASLMHYPLTVTFESVRVPLAAPPTLLERFDEVFTPEVRRGLAAALTIDDVNGHARVVAIAVPRPSDDVPGAASRDPRRIAVRAGPRPTRVAGSLASGGTDVYVVFVPKGQLLQVRLDRGRTEAAIAIVNARTGARIPGAGAGGFTGRVTESADYHITVRHTGPVDAPPLPYVLSVSIR